MVKGRKGEVNWTLIVTGIAAIVVLVVYLVFFTGGTGGIDIPLKTDKQLARDLCEVHCADASRSTTCVQWRSKFCDEYYYDGQNCSAVVDQIACVSPVEECACVVFDEWED